MIQIEKDLSIKFLVCITLFTTQLCWGQTIEFPKYGIPNHLEIADNFYCDKTEVSNIAWREYMYWNKSVFGPNSDEYLETIPDSNVWLRIDSSLNEIGSTYLANPEYSEYPVVGVSQNQAILYSKWRSDRVLQMHLNTEFGYKSHRPTKDNYFTIERYLQNKLDNYPLKEEVKYYAQFDLPTEVERAKILEHYEKSLIETTCHITKGSNEDNSMASYIFKPHFSGLNIENIEKFGFVTRKYENKDGLEILENLLGNVAEWSKKKDVVYGCSWRCISLKTKNEDSTIEKQANAWTGFRNVAHWKKVQY